MLKQFKVDKVLFMTILLMMTDGDLLQTVLTKRKIWSDWAAMWMEMDGWMITPHYPLALWRPVLLACPCNNKSPIPHTHTHTHTCLPYTNRSIHSLACLWPHKDALHHINGQIPKCTKDGKTYSTWNLNTHS